MCLNWNKGRLVEKLTRTQKGAAKQGVAALKRSHPVCISIVFSAYFYCIPNVFLFAKQGVAVDKRWDPGGRHNPQCFAQRNLAQARQGFEPITFQSPLDHMI